MSTITIEHALLERAVEYLESYCDKGPAGQGWQSEELEDVIGKLRNRLVFAEMTPKRATHLLYDQADLLVFNLWYGRRNRAYREGWGDRWERIHARAKARKQRRWEAYTDACIAEVVNV